MAESGRRNGRKLKKAETEDDEDNEKGAGGNKSKTIDKPALFQNAEQFRAIRKAQS